MHSTQYFTHLVETKLYQSYQTLAGVNMPNMKKTARARVCDMRRHVLAPGYWLDLPSSLSALCPGGRHISIGGVRSVGLSEAVQAMGNARSKGARSLDPHLPILAPPLLILRPPFHMRSWAEREGARQVVLTPLQTMTNYE